MREICTDELKNIQLDILKRVHLFCCQNNIEYFLTYGTLIGAIRHQGYIPWDDDIDIEMTRPNYEKFIKLFNGYYPDLKICAPELDCNYYAPYANVYNANTILYEGNNGHNGFSLGIKIDVFPIDGVPDNKKGYDKFFNKAKLINTLLIFKRYPLSYLIRGGFYSKFLRLVTWCFTHIIPYSFLQKRMKALTQKIPYEEATHASQIVFAAKRRFFNKELYENFIDVEFEGFKFRTIKDYDIYLKEIYGDYMKLPPIEERIACHNFKAYWIN